MEEDVKNIVFKATILPILTYGISNFNLSDQNIRMIEAKWDHLNKRLYENMDKPEIELDIWKSYKGYHRSELNNPNIIEWIQSKRLRALYRAVEPTLQLIQDPSRYYKTLLYGIDPNRDRDRPDGQQQGKERSQKFHPTMRYVLRKDHQQMKEIWQEYEEFHSQMEQQPEDSKTSFQPDQPDIKHSEPANITMFYPASTR